MWFAFIIALSYLPLLIYAALGVDVSSSVSKANWQCIKNAGYDIAVIRAYQSLGKPDPNAVATIKNAHDGGIGTVDVYMFPCPKCAKNAVVQASELVDNLDKAGARYRTIWIDVEGTQYWHPSQTDNREFITSVANTLKARGKRVGVYASKSQWDPIVGNWDGMKSYPLWYPHYDNDKSFNDFKPFGGWTKPYMKQFKGTTTLCSSGVDLNYLPSI
ncbi:uncharacterized protein VTP21DRAFT_2898 [Calcarisporiella thermophila]|uniref:uncharacterized protein n=1 Tax=Calcarisporiella thermophila TaxID=911321 RepID=UPI00374212B6